MEQIWNFAKHFNFPSKKHNTSILKTIIRGNLYGGTPSQEVKISLEQRFTANMLWRQTVCLDYVKMLEFFSKC